MRSPTRPILMPAVVFALLMSGGCAACSNDGAARFCSNATIELKDVKKVDGPLPAGAPDAAARVRDIGASGSNQAIPGLQHTFQIRIGFEGGPLNVVRLGVGDACYFEMPTHPEMANQPSQDDAETTENNERLLATAAARAADEILLEGSYGPFGAPSKPLTFDLSAQVVGKDGKPSKAGSLGTMTVCTSSGDCGSAPAQGSTGSTGTSGSAGGTTSGGATTGTSGGTGGTGGTSGCTDTGSGLGLFMDINSTYGSNPHYFVVAGSHTYFLAGKDSTGYQLWVTDGTCAGTQQLSSVPNPDWRPLSRAGVLGGRLVFSDYQSLYVSDGTAAGTTKLYDFQTMGDFFAATSDRVYFTAKDAASGFELWSTDGTAAGTHLVLDEAPGPTSSSARPGAVLGNRYIFYAYHEDAQSHLVGHVYATAGGANDAVALTPDNGLDSGAIYYAGAAPLGADKVIFEWATDATGAGPWVTDGTPAGTHLLKDLDPASGPGTGSYVHHLTPHGNHVFFDSELPYALWDTDGTEAGTVQVAPVNLYVNHSGLVPWGSGFAFAGRGPNTNDNWGLWFTDGTPGGTHVVSDAANLARGTRWINTVGGETGLAQYPPMVELGGKLLFYGQTSNEGVEPWVSDGTAAGTTLLVDAYPGATGSTIDQSGFVTLGDKAYFISTVGSSATKRLFVTDGTPGGTLPIAPPGLDPANSDFNSLGEEPVRMGSTLLLGAKFDDALGFELYRLGL